MAPDNLKAIEDIVSTMTEADKSVLMELYFEDGLYYQTIINKQDNEKERKRVAEEVLTNLFTSDTERYNRYINQVHHDCNPGLCMKNEKNFMDHSHTEEYLELYEKYCTQNCLKNMGREHLFTYVDYLASLSEKVVQCINIKLNRINEGEDEYSFEAVLKEADSNQQIKEYSVTGKIAE